MKLTTQISSILILAFALGVINNFRSHSHIPWTQKWTSLEELNKKMEPQPAKLDPQEVEALLVENMGKGPTDIPHSVAKSIFDNANDLVVWIDARDEELYNMGHIPGALLLDFYNQMDYLDQVEEIIRERSPVSLVLYCKGADCHDSHMLADSLHNLGYDNIFVYKGGWGEWYEDKHLPIEGRLAQTEATTQPEPPKNEKVQGMYLEHVVRDMVPFLAGFLFLVLWKKFRSKNLPQMLGALLTGVFFIWASVPKIETPFVFAKNIWNYNLIPDFGINGMALVMPWIECLAGIALILGMIRPEFRPYLLKGASFIISALLVIFIIAVSINVIRGHEFNCGCTSETVYFKTLFLKGWNDKFTLLLRDVGLLILSLSAFFSRLSPIRKVATD